MLFRSEINKNYFELESKFDKFNRDYKLKLKENENSLSIETQKYTKMEKYYLSQLNDKEKLINSLELKSEKINKEMQTLSKENTIKINELNRENNRLSNEIERIKEIKNKSGDYGLGSSSDKNVNVQSILKTVSKNFLDFKESVDNLKNENDSIQKNKYLELSKEEIENKLNNVLNDVKNFCSLQIKTVSDNYEKLISKAKNDFEELNFEMSKKDYALNEQMLLKETYEKKFNESNKSLEKFISIEKDWVPEKYGTSLYIRPFLIATAPELGLHDIDDSQFVIIASPVGNYYKEGINPVSIMIESEDVRAVRGGTGYAKCGGNYAASNRAGDRALAKGYSQVL